MITRPGCPFAWLITSPSMVCSKHALYELMEQAGVTLDA